MIILLIISIFTIILENVVGSQSKQMKNIANFEKLIEENEMSYLNSRQNNNSNKSEKWNLTLANLTDQTKKDNSNYKNDYFLSDYELRTNINWEKLIKDNTIYLNSSREYNLNLKLNVELFTQFTDIYLYIISVVENKEVELKRIKYSKNISELDNIMKNFNITFFEVKYF
jgi:hypothetical protein